MLVRQLVRQAGGVAGCSIPGDGRGQARSVVRWVIGPALKFTLSDRGIRDNARVPGLTADAVVYAAPDRQLSTNLAGEIVILDVERGLYFGLSEVGVVIWEAMQSPIAIAAIVERVVRAYDVPSETAEVDTIELVSELAARGLVEIDRSIRA